MKYLKRFIKFIVRIVAFFIGLILYIFEEARLQQYHIKRWLNKADK
jgi:hypothetical protein